jgi:hypothetical protein
MGFHVYETGKLSLHREAGKHEKKETKKGVGVSV